LTSRLFVVTEVTSSLRFLKVASSIASGFHYDGVEKTIGFAPRFRPEDFRAFWSSGQGWGVYRQETARGKLSARIELLRGTMELNGISLGTGDSVMKSATLTLGGKKLPSEVKTASGAIFVQLKKGIVLSPRGVLEIQAG
jgi:non-lysosomal glucosylceramidase